VNNSAMLACCLVKLEDFQAAVDAARKANVMSTWKQVCFSCVEAQKFRLAQMCALNIIVRIDELHELCRYYERLGHFAELITVLEQGINLDRAHKGIYTQLGICYSRYKEEKLMEHIKYFWSRLNIPTLLQECQKSLHWPEAVYLYSHQDQYDNAIDVMINHSAACWDDKLFKDTIVQVANTEVYYRAIDFYLQEHPLLLNPLLMDLVNKVDHARVVHVLNRAGHVALVERYLRAVQKDDIGAVNECLNELYVAAGDYKSLRASVEAYHTFDQISLAQKLDKHDLVEFRRIASYLYFMNKKYEKSIELSKRDELWQDAMETAAASEDAALVEGLLRFFVENENKPAFTACLYACYAFVRPDVVMELAWRFNLMDFAMPFMVQTMADMSSKLSYVTNKLNEADKAKADAEAEQKKQEDQAQEMGYAMNNLALAPPPGAMQQQYGNNGMQQQQQYGNNGMQLPTQGFY
jgi:clathrin heavy chain